MYCLQGECGDISAHPVPLRVCQAFLGVSASAAATARDPRAPLQHIRLAMLLGLMEKEGTDSFSMEYRRV